MNLKAISTILIVVIVVAIVVIGGIVAFFLFASILLPRIPPSLTTTGTYTTPTQGYTSPTTSPTGTPTYTFTPPAGVIDVFIGYEKFKEGPNATLFLIVVPPNAVFKVGQSVRIVFHHNNSWPPYLIFTILGPDFETVGEGVPLFPGYVESVIYCLKNQEGI